MRAMDPSELLFWGVMSLGVIAGFALAYPFNVWMVAKRLKHGLMTMRAGRGQASSRHGKHQPAKQHGKSHGHQHGGDDQPDPVFAPTRPQIPAMAGITALMLLTGMVTPGFWVNLRLGAFDVGGAIMPPGMIMGFDTPAEAMRDMAAVPPRRVSYAAPADARGDVALAPRIEDGAKVFDIEASVIRWNILPGETVEAFAYNHQIPGPRLEVTQGDRVRINLRNALPERLCTGTA